MRRERKRKVGDGLVTVAEIAAFVYAEQWRLEHGLGLESGNRDALDADDRHHRGKAMAERFSGRAVVIGQWLAVLAILALVLLAMLWR